MSSLSSSFSTESVQPFTRLFKNPKANQILKLNREAVPPFQLCPNSCAMQLNGESIQCRDISVGFESDSVVPSILDVSDPPMFPIGLDLNPVSSEEGLSVNNQPSKQTKVGTSVVRNPENKQTEDALTTDASKNKILEGRKIDFKSLSFPKFVFDPLTGCYRPRKRCVTRRGLDSDGYTSTKKYAEAWDTKNNELLLISLDRFEDHGKAPVDNVGRSMTKNLVSQNKKVSVAPSTRVTSVKEKNNVSSKPKIEPTPVRPKFHHQKVIGFDSKGNEVSYTRARWLYSKQVRAGKEKKVSSKSFKQWCERTFSENPTDKVKDR